LYQAFFVPNPKFSNFRRIPDSLWLWIFFLMNFWSLGFGYRCRKYGRRGRCKYWFGCST
jgi:hypothetical protein